ncbi:hypothetical protein [Prosthecobacter dejongeii]|uniref:Uncharacterized protein n=1 Tax=Prosthecobacter dejongeii TaxID=48465 RepID=A0A7W7YNW4_9BACT|nr:hypothetical protein [Prosthecobacter dejongeii]MBB5039646.1 hypothetical protein [Prosthecobacter dejongeii]
MTPEQLEIGRQIEQTRFLIGEAQEKLGAGVDPQTFIRQQNEELVKQSARGGVMSRAEQEQASIDADRYEAAEKILELQERLEKQQRQMAAAGASVAGPAPGGPSGPGGPGGSSGAVLSGPTSSSLKRDIAILEASIDENQQILGEGVDPQTFIQQQNDALVAQSRRGGVMSAAEQQEASVNAQKYEAAEKILNLQDQLTEKQKQLGASAPSVSSGGPSADGDSGGSKSVRERMRDALQKLGSEQKLSAVDSDTQARYKAGKKELDDLLKKESKALSSALNGDVGSLDDLKTESPAEKKDRAEKIQNLQKKLAEMKEKDPGLAQLDRNTVGRNVHSAVRDLANKVGQKLK